MVDWINQSTCRHSNWPNWMSAQCTQSIVPFKIVIFANKSLTVEEGHFSIEVDVCFCHKTQNTNVSIDKMNHYLILPFWQWKWSRRLGNWFGKGKKISVCLSHCRRSYESKRTRGGEETVNQVIRSNHTTHKTDRSLLYLPEGKKRNKRNRPTH